MATITCHAQYADGTPVTALYVTLESLQDSSSCYEGVTDYDGDITEWYEAAADHKSILRTTSAFGDVNSNWRMSFHVKEHLTHFPGIGLPFGHICTHFSVRMAPQHHINLRLASHEYIITHGGGHIAPRDPIDREVNQPFALRHPQPLPPLNHFVNNSEDMMRHSPQTPEAFTPTRIHSADFISLFEKSIKEESDGDPEMTYVMEETLDTTESVKIMGTPVYVSGASFKRKRDSLDDEVVLPRRSRRLMELKN
ncbi:hypothetical protein V8F06_013885 [Rhypophila decipiens]